MHWLRYTLAPAAVGLTLIVRLALSSTESEPLLELFQLPIILSAYIGGLGPGLLATVLAAMLTDYALIEPTSSFTIGSGFDRAEWAILILTGALVSVLSEGLHRSRRYAETSRELQAVTLASIGDAVITTSLAGRVTFLNAEAERLTAWANREALGQSLGEVFRIVDEQSRAPAEDPATKVLRTGAVVGLANHTILIARDGREHAIDDSGAPIRRSDGSVAGVVLIFRDVSAQRQAEAAMLKSERALKLFVEHAPAAIAMFDQKMTYLAASRRYMIDYHLPTQQVIGRSHYEIFPEIPDRWKQIHQRCLAGAVERAEEDPFPRADGSLDWVRWEIHPWYERPNEVGGVILFSEVITERKQAEIKLRESEARFHRTLDSMLEGCQIIGFDWCYLYVNDSVARHARRSKEDLLGRTMMEIIPGLEQTPLFDTLRRCMHERTSHRIENHFDYGEGVFAWFDLSIQPSPEGIFILSIDVTERKQAEAEVQRLYDELEQRVAERTAELEAANKELEAFSYSVSHDLRAPLRAIDGFSRILLEDYSASLPDEGQRYFGLVRESAQQMGRLVDDLLAFSRLSRQPLTVRPVDPAELVQQCLAELRDEQDGRQITIHVGDLPDCQGDPALLKQIWINLIANALKYTRRREHASIEIGCREEDGEPVYFIQDNGVGFDRRYSHKLFGVFQRLHRAEDYEGTGVGLAIVERIIHRHGGRIWAEAEVDKGATFFFTLGRSRYE